jgi:hypothetical protein
MDMGPLRSYRHPGETVLTIGCDVHAHALLIAGRYLRWRCTHHHCPGLRVAKQQGGKLYHVQDLETGEVWDEIEFAHADAA